jgi:hypothetical protein
MFSAQVRLPYFRHRDLEAAHGARHTRRSPALDAVAGGGAVRVQIHVVRRLLRRAFAEIDEGRPAVGEANQHVAAAADVAGVGMRHGHRETDRDRGVDRVAAFCSTETPTSAAIDSIATTIPWLARTG